MRTNILKTKRSGKRRGCAYTYTYTYTYIYIYICVCINRCIGAQRKQTWLDEGMVKGRQKEKSKANDPSSSVEQHMV